MTQEDHYLSTDSGTGLYFAIPQLPADRQECGKGVMPKPKHPHPLPPMYSRLNLLPFTPLPLSGTLWGTWIRLSAPLFQLMRFSCLSKRQLGTAPALTTSLSLTISLYVCVHMCTCSALVCSVHKHRTGVLYILYEQILQVFISLVTSYVPLPLLSCLST